MNSFSNSINVSIMPVSRSVRHREQDLFAQRRLEKGKEREEREAEQKRKRVNLENLKTAETPKPPPSP